MNCPKCGSKNVKVASYNMELDRTFYECQECEKMFSDADKMKCSQCGEIIEDSSKAINIDGETFCSNVCAEEYTFFNVK